MHPENDASLLLLRFGKGDGVFRRESVFFPSAGDRKDAEGRTHLTRWKADSSCAKARSGEPTNPKTKTLRKDFRM